MRALYASENKSHSFRVFKQADGSYRWVTISSSAFRDRDGEIVTAKALEGAVERMDARQDHGPLRWWHIGEWEYPQGPEAWESWRAGKGVDIGSCDFSMIHDKVLLESGTFKSAEMGEAFSKPGMEMEVSIAFSHPSSEPDTKKEYQNINIFERSLLPAGMASNLLTRLYVNKEGESTMKAMQKLQALSAILRDKPDVVKQILEDAEGVQKAAEMAGLEYKELTDTIEGEGEACEVETPEVPVVETPEPKPEEVIPALETAAEPTAEKAAAQEEPKAEAAEVEEDVIGDWSSQKLAAFVAQTVKAVMEAGAGEKKERDAVIEQSQVDLITAVKALSARIETAEATTKITQQSLFELTDSPPRWNQAVANRKGNRAN